MLFRSRKPRALNLALQGGGAHGAFAWGAIVDSVGFTTRCWFELIQSGAVPVPGYTQLDPTVPCPSQARSSM